jgi:nicotinamidase-related amidase
MNNTLIVIVDLQNDFTLPGGKVPACTAEVDQIFAPLNTALAHGRSAGVHAVVLSTRWGNWLMRLLTRNSVAPESHGAKLDPRLQADDATHLIKPGKSAFSSAQFAQHLQEQEVQHLVLCGLAAEHCIAATAKAALQRGLQVTLITDAIASYECGARDKVFKTLVSQGAKPVSTAVWIAAK